MREVAERQSAVAIDTSIAYRRDEPVGSDAAELSTEIVTDVESIRGLRPDYEGLYRLTRNTLPFALQEWHLTWCRHFLSRGRRVYDQPLFCVSRDSMGACVGIVPLVVTRRQLGPVRLATVGLIGSDPGLTEIRSPLVKPDFEHLIVRAVHQCLATVPDWHWFEWSGVSTAMAQSMTGGTAPLWYRTSEDFMLDLPSSWQEMHAGMSRNLRESLRHCYNSLKRDGHTFEFVVARERGEVRQALRRFLQLHAMRADMSSGAKHPNRFATRSLQAFLYDVCDVLAARDVVRVFQLRIRGQIVASRVAFVVGDGVYLYYSGFDPAWARYSIMTTTIAEAIKYAIAAGLRTVNLSLTAEQSKLRWRPRRVMLHSGILLHHESMSSRLAYEAYRMAQSGSGAPARLLKSAFRAHRDWT